MKLNCDSYSPLQSVCPALLTFICLNYYFLIHSSHFAVACSLATPIAHHPLPGNLLNHFFPSVQMTLKLRVKVASSNYHMKNLLALLRS